jgi:hypothetical protein
MAKRSSNDLPGGSATEPLHPEPTSGSPAEHPDTAKIHPGVQTGPTIIGRLRKPMPRTDPELQAMARIDRILAELDGNQQRRVVEWIRDRFGPQPKFGPFPGAYVNSHDTVKESTR